MSPRSLSAALLAIALAIALASGGTAGTSHFDVQLDPAIDTPDKTESTQLGKFTITQIGRIDPGGTLDATVTVGSGTDYNLEVFNSEEQLYERKADLTGDGTVPVTIDSEPGSYVVAIWVDGDYEDVEPVVLKKFDISVTAPGSATEDTSVNVSATLTEIDSGNTLDRVQVVIGDGNENLRRELTKESESGTTLTYEESVDVSSLSPGDYDLYVVAQGPDTVYDGGQELLGASTPQTFSVESASTPTESDDPSGGDGGGGGGGGGARGGSSTSTATATTTGGTPTPTTAPTTTVPSTDETATDDGTENGGTVGGTTDQSVITPNTGTSVSTTNQQSETEGQPGFGVAAALVGLLFAALLARRR